MAREIIKDMEDFEGDKATGGQTIPIVWGLRSSKLIAFFLLVITAMLLLFVVYNTVKLERVVFSLNVLYIILALIAPLLALALYTLRSGFSKQFKRASLFLKLVMFVGLCYSIIFYYQ